MHHRSEVHDPAAEELLELPLAARLQAALGHGDDEQVATVLTFGHPARPRDPEKRSAEEWIERADRRPLEEIVEER